MSLNLELFSEPYGSTGNIGDNIKRLLGAPSLDPLQTLIRESLQNVADAAKLGVGPAIEIRVRHLTSEQRSALEDQVISTLPVGEQSNSLLRETLAKDKLVVMEICDFHTVGLGGPTRSDRVPLGTSNTQFINFLRNIGVARNTARGGGTYGFGKVALYKASHCSTIIVDTLPHESGLEGRRLIGCHVGPSFEVAAGAMSRRFTGRHWWGVADPEDGVVDPVTGGAAQELAAALGMPEREGSRTGTSIMILDVIVEDEDIQAFAGRIIEAILWNFWPRMMRNTPASLKFDLRLEVEGKHFDIPSPEALAPLDLFCKAMNAARSGSGNNVIDLFATKSNIKVGALAIEKGLRGKRRNYVADNSLIPAVSQHIALMRPVGLVVKYLMGTALPDERLEWGGVFIVNDEEEVESAFAEAEPPAHDDWIPENLEKGVAKTLVNVALRDLRRIASEVGLSSITSKPKTQAGPPLAKLAGRLGAALEGVSGDGAGRARNNKSGGRKLVTHARASGPQFVRLESVKSGAVAVFRTEVRQDAKRSATVLIASASVAVDGGRAVEAGGGLPEPVVLSISSVDGNKSATGNRLSIEGDDGFYEIRVMMPHDCAVVASADVIVEAKR
ncbi:hypothetical protein [Pseudomonas monteilii]|uniref:hypothetical protein n=1 Tax=Pseudomonas monteilii TaxID=76759 RepID=UPI0036EA530F